MIEAIFNDNQGMLATALVSALILALLFFVIGRRRGNSGLAWGLTGAALAVEVTATLYPISLGAPASATCVIERDLITGTFTTQGLMNVLLFLGLGAFATWATRRPVPVTLACIGLSAATEVTQALTPGIGRACDSIDLWANSLGAVLGAGALAAILRWRDTRGADGAGIAISRRQIRWSLIGFAAGIAAIGLVASFTVTFVMAEVAWANNSTSEQRTLARETVEDFFDGQAELKDVQYRPGPPGQPSVVSANTDRGTLDIELPSEEVVSGVLQHVSPPLEPNTPPVTDTAALKSGTDFVRTRFPWALAGQTELTAAGPQGASKLLSWRSRKAGVLMPMRMDVVVGPDASVISFAARHIADPSSMPSPHLDKKQAQAVASNKFTGKEFQLTDLIARTDSTGNWRPYWIVAVGSPASPNSGSPESAPEGGVAQDGSSMDGVPQDGAPSSDTNVPTRQVWLLDAVTGAIRPAGPEQDTPN
ncbi:VanZ family protein [Streptomyces sp. NPDC099050]|uniref:VanZ family protein n=1 Tax=Streptomyces sp. NPDC099050 TaxID=3366100 RepID=UPI003818AB62